MKTKVAKQIIRSAANGTIYPLHTLHKASLQANLPVLVKTTTYDYMVYCPKKLRGKFVMVHNWNRRFECKDSWFASRSTAILPVTLDLKNQYEHVTELKSPVNGILWYYPVFGCDIEYAIASACQLSRNFQTTIQFDFNQVSFEVRPNHTEKQLDEWWISEIERSQLEWYKSTEGINRLAEISQKQVEIERLIGVVETLPKNDGTHKNSSTWLNWLYDFCILGENRYLNYDKQQLLQALEAGGWVSGHHVIKLEGDVTDETINTACEIFQEKIKDSPQVYAEYIMGQAIESLKDGLGVNSICRKFIDEYRGIDLEAKAS